MRELRPSVPEPGTIIAGYRLGRVVGRGSAGVVYLATHEALGRTAALKLLSPGSAGLTADRFHREARAQAALDDPGILPVYAFGESEHGLYLVMRLVEGRPIAGLVEDGALDPAQAIRLLWQIAGALDAAHEAGLLHRDITPGNVLIEGERAYLTDFGLARPTGAATLTGTGELVGTLGYMAPEVLTGGPAGPAADRYALAAVAFEALTGGPVHARVGPALLHAHAHEPVPRASERRPELAVEVDGVFERALAKRPDARPASARALVAELARALALPSPGTVPTALRTRRRLALALLAALALVGAVALALVVLAPDPGPDDAAPEALPDATVLGSALAEGGETMSCDGSIPSATSPACTLLQRSPASARSAIPRSGLLRRWTVRGAEGELAVQVIRREGSLLRSAVRGQFHLVPDTGVHSFGEALPVRRGDRLAVEVTPASGIGVAPSPGARTERWIDPLGSEPGDEPRPASPGPDAELLVRFEVIPGVRPGEVNVVAGPRARTLPRGERLAESVRELPGGGVVELAVVRLPGRVAIDLGVGGERRARATVRGADPAGRLVRIAPDDLGRPGILIEWDNPGGNPVFRVFRFSRRTLFPAA